MAKDKINRYSDEELQEFKTLIEEKLVESREDLENMKLTLSHEGDHGTDDTSRTFNMMEDGSDTMEREKISKLAAQKEKYITSLQNALIRIENKTYGVCYVTGNLIKKERLYAVPNTTQSIAAKMAQG